MGTKRIPIAAAMAGPATLVFSRRRRAFTLVELLVVVAIIAILLAVLLPALGRAKELARTALCGTNLHQLHVAFNTYATEELDYLPDTGISRADLSTSGNYRHQFLFIWYKQTADYLMDHYLGGQFRVMRCPSSDPDQNESTWERASEPDTVWTTYSSMTSRYLGTHYRAASASVEIDYCEKTSNTPSTNVFMTDTLLRQSSNWQLVKPHPGTGTGTEAARGRNLMTMDGSVEWKNLEDVERRIVSIAVPNRWYYW